MSWYHRLRNGESVFQPLAHRTRFAAVAAVILAVAVAGLLFAGFDPGTDFAGGGTAVEAENTAGLTLAQYREALADAGFGGVRIQRTVDGAGVLVRAGALDAGERDALIAAVAEASAVDPSDVVADVTGPVVGWDPLRVILYAAGLFAAVAVVVVGWRIGLKAALTAVAVLVFDVAVTTGIYALTGMEVMPATVAAVVGIVAYSLYDTVVVFERMKDVHGELGSRFDVEYIGNLSFNRLLLRSLVTSLSVGLALLVVLALSAFRAGTGPVVSVLTVLLIGVLVSGYSSLGLGISLLTLWPQPLPGPRTRGRSRRRRRREARRPATIADETEDTGAVPRPPRHSRRR